MEEGCLGLQSEVRAHGRQASTPLVAPSVLDDRLVQYLRVEEIDLPRLGQLGGDRQVGVDGDFEAEFLERLEVSGGVVEDLRVRA